MFTKITLSILAGVLITGFSYTHKSYQDYSNSDPGCDGSNIYAGACAPLPLFAINHGFPLGYIAVDVYPNPSYRGEVNIKPLGLLADVALWSSVSFGLIFGLNKIKSINNQSKKH